jgi:hypothetical protein
MKLRTQIALSLFLLSLPALAQDPGEQTAQTAPAQTTPAQATPAPVLPPTDVRRVMPMPPQRDSQNDPIAVAQRDPVILTKLAHARRLNVLHEESVLPVPIGSTCGAAGCTETTLVAFTFRTLGVGTQGRSVLALVTCKAPAGKCQVTPAEVRAPLPLRPAAQPLRPVAQPLKPTIQPAQPVQPVRPAAQQPIQPRPIQPQQTPAPQRALRTPGPTPG